MTFFVVLIVVLALLQIPVYLVLAVLNAIVPPSSYAEKEQGLWDYTQNDGNLPKEKNSLGVTDDFIIYSHSGNGNGKGVRT